MKRLSFYLVISCVLFSVLSAYGFEGIITTKTEFHQGADMPSQPDEEEIADAENEIEQMKEDLKGLSGDDRKWLENEIETQEGYLAELSGENAGGSIVTRTYIKDSWTRVVDESDPNNEIIFKDQSMIMINHSEQSYSQISIEEFRKMMKDIKESFSSVLDQDSRRRLDEEMKNEAEKQQKVKIEKTGKMDKILGYSCELVIATIGEDRNEIWMTYELGDVLRPFHEMYESFQSDLSDQFSADVQDLEMEALRQLKGVPLKMIKKEGDQVMEESEVTQIEEKSLSDSEFSPPASYKKEEGLSFQR